MSETPELKAAGRGQVLVGVILVMMVLLIMVPALVTWLQQEAKMSVKNRKSTTAFNLADAAVERGMWKLKSSTATWTQASSAITISGYHFDVTYTDVPGGTYRVQFSSGVSDGNATVLVWGEGRDAQNKETRSIQAVYQNETIPGAIISGGTLQTGTAYVNWGPVMAHNNITVANAATAPHFPRKMSTQAVVSSPAGYYDTTWPIPPNTDNLEWWSAYDVPELPIFDFTALRSSAAASVPNNTVNCNGQLSANGNQALTDQVSYHGGPMGLLPCSTAVSSCVNCVVGNIFQDNRFDANDVWYWDNNLVMNNPGINGTTIVRGNLLTNNGDWYGPYGPYNKALNLHVPANAWLEYQKIDTSGTGDYPADNGLNKSQNTYILGSCGTLCETGNSNANNYGSGSDVGFYGFVYVGGNITVDGDADMYGAIWVVGNWTAAGGGNVIMFNNNLKLPLLNVVLVRQSWNEVGPSKVAWQ